MNHFELAFGVTLFKRLSKGMAGAGMGLRAVRLRGVWAKRELRIVAREAAHLLPAA